MHPTLIALHLTALVALAASIGAQGSRPPAPPAPTPGMQDPAGPMGWTGVLDEKAFAALHDLKSEKAPALRGSMVPLGDGKAYLSLPAGKPPFPAVLVIHEWWGLNDHVKHWTDRLAADGYAALAVDLYQGKQATTREEASAAMQAVDESRARATLLQAARFLKEDPRVQASRRGSIGWCFGGGWSLQLALAAPDLDAAVIYYGRLVDDAEALKAIRAPVLGIFGTRDRGIPPAAVERFAAGMKAAGRDLVLRNYDADHAFANPSGARYDAENAAKAWTEVRAFLGVHLKGEKPEAAPRKAGRAANPGSGGPATGRPRVRATRSARRRSSSAPPRWHAGARTPTARPSRRTGTRWPMTRCCRRTTVPRVRGGR
jgi:carboxymethylenebutenolidase